MKNVSGDVKRVANSIWDTARHVNVSVYTYEQVLNISDKIWGITETVIYL